jgi:undecaprenyl pyrophosphate synthase
MVDDPKLTGWTPELVREHVLAILAANDKRYEERFAAQEKAVKDALAAQEKAVNAALAASEKAVSVAETNAEKWRSNANEWRSAMTDREKRFVSQQEYQLLKERMDKGEGGGKGMRDMWGWIAAAAMLAVAAAGVFGKYIK